MCNVISFLIYFLTYISFEIQYRTKTRLVYLMFNI